MATKLSSKLPEYEANGLGVIFGDLVRTPEKTHVVLCLVDCAKTAKDTDSGSIEPTVRIRHIEPVKGDDAALCAAILRRALEERAGVNVLPGLEEDLFAPSAEVDPVTGEILN